MHVQSSSSILVVLFAGVTSVVRVSAVVVLGAASVVLVNVVVVLIAFVVGVVSGRASVALASGGLAVVETNTAGLVLADEEVGEVMGSVATEDHDVVVLSMVGRYTAVMLDTH